METKKADKADKDMQIEDMTIVAHICHYSSPGRMNYLKEVLATLLTYKCKTIDISVHSNAAVVVEEKNPRGTITVHKHELKEPYDLPWRCRDLLALQSKSYDVFMYLEDDIAVPFVAFQYWHKWHKYMRKHELDVGFVRIEQRQSNKEFYVTDQRHQLTEIRTINDVPFVQLENIYCAFWIYDQDELMEYMKSPWWHYEPHHWGTGQREDAAIGVKFVRLASMAPLLSDRKTLAPECCVHHLPNNYANAPSEGNCYGRIKVCDLIKN